MEDNKFETIVHCYNPAAEQQYDCGKVAKALLEALGSDYEVVYEKTNFDSYEHDCNVIFKLRDGRFLHAECGGCSCEGAGSWSYQETAESAFRMVPDYYSDSKLVEAKAKYGITNG